MQMDKLDDEIVKQWKFEIAFDCLSSKQVDMLKGFFYFLQ